MCEIAIGSIAKVEINLLEVVQGRVQIIFQHVPLAAPLFSIFATKTGKKSCSSTMLLCIICQIATGSIAKVEVNPSELG